MLPPRLSFSILALLVFVLIGELAFLDWREHQPKESVYDPVIVAIARAEEVDPFLVRALIWRESRFNPSIYGLAQEHGLMQVTPAVGEEWARANKIPNFKPEDLFDPVTNIRAGTWYLSQALRRWSQTEDPVPFALAEYNAGRSNALKWVDPADPQNPDAFVQRITYPSTRRYLEVILEKRAEYRMLLARNRWYKEFASNRPAMTPSP